MPFKSISVAHWRHTIIRSNFFAFICRKPYQIQAPTPSLFVCYYLSWRWQLLSSTAQQDFYLFNTGLSKEIILLYLVFGILLSVCSYQQNNAVNNHQTKKAPFHFQLQRIWRTFLRQIQAQELETDDVIGFMDG